MKNVLLGVLLLAVLTVSFVGASEPSGPVDCSILRKCNTKYMPVCGGTPGCTATFQNDCIFATYVCNRKLKDYRLVSRGTCPVITL